jgi:16S rRNA (cytosine1402-N4)-methyltransferase
MLRRPSTPAGQHRPVLLKEVLEVLDPQPGATVVDCTVGWAGHAAELLKRACPQGRLIGFDFDADNLVKARERLEPIGCPFSLHHGNFAGLANILAAEGIAEVDLLLADLGMSSMQVDDAERGFSYVRDGPLDMRMDRSRGKTAAQLLATISEEDLRAALQDYGDEPEADKIAKAITEARQQASILRTGDLAKIIGETTRNGKPQEQWRLRPAKNKWNIHPAARTFQALRILVNRELANLGQLLRVLPTILKSGGRAAIVSFHSGEDRLVKAAFREGHRAGVYGTRSQDPIRASFSERTSNPRSRSAKLRWAEKLSKADS